MRPRRPAADGTGRRARPRGVTLLELMIALALLVGLTAIALPSVFGVMERRAYESAVQLVSNQLLLARAHAQSTGRPVEVRFRGEDGLLVARLFDLRALRAEGDAAARGADDPRRRERPDEREAPDAPPMPSTIPEHWAVVRLADGVTISRDAPPNVDDAVFDAASDADAFAAADRVPASGLEPGSQLVPQSKLDTPPETIRIAVFLPDGSTLSASPVWVAGAGGRAGTLSVNPWTGLPAFEAHDPGATGEQTAVEDVDDETAASAEPAAPEPPPARRMAEPEDEPDDEGRP